MKKMTCDFIDSRLRYAIGRGNNVPPEGVLNAVGRVAFPESF
jgi:hypothetical protein